jgi:KaiC/GvpD/RAD55 family RecA-like ATPase
VGPSAVAGQEILVQPTTIVVDPVTGPHPQPVPPGAARPKAASRRKAPRPAEPEPAAPATATAAAVVAPEAPPVAETLAPATALAELEGRAPAAVSAVAAPVAVLPPRSTPGFEFQPARAAEQKLSTGVDRLDQLLGGGYTPGCATLLFGPPFCGKQQLQQQAIVRAAREGVPVTVLLHTIGAEAMSLRLQALDPTFAAAEAAGLVRYIDVHSKALGEPTEHPHTTYVADPHDLAGLLKALEADRGRRAHRAGLMAIESASTILIDLGPAKAFTFLRTVLGRTLTAGGVGLVCLEGGMHPDSEVQMAKHLCAGMIEMRKKGEAHCLHVEGLETAYARPGWIEYEFTARQFRVTGSFASRTIR